MLLRPKKNRRQDKTFQAFLLTISDLIFEFKITIAPAAVLYFAGETGLVSQEAIFKAIELEGKSDKLPLDKIKKAMWWVKGRGLRLGAGH